MKRLGHAMGVAGSKALGGRKGVFFEVESQALNHLFPRFQRERSEGVNLLFIYRLFNETWSRTALQNGKKPMAIGFLGAGPKMPGVGGGFDASQLTSLALKATMQRQAPTAGVAARADRGPAVVVAIDPRAAERGAEIARLAEEAEAASAAAEESGGRPMAAPDWNKKMIAEMIDQQRRQVWAISETLRVYDETGEVVSFGLSGERFVSSENWAAYGGPEKYIEMNRKGLEISKAALRDLETRVTPKP
jgi:hypothetical protein